MKIALCQINQTVGKLETNRDKIISYYKNSIAEGSDLTVFPELAITGYPPQDLLFEKNFIEISEESFDKICSEVGSIPLILGHVYQESKFLYNAASILQNGKVVGRHKKILLPNYDVFDEHRYFSPGTESKTIEVFINGSSISIGLQICEDLWNDSYSRNVTRELIEDGSDLIINISASPYSSGKSGYREKLIKERVLKFSTPFLYCNLVGAQDELIFDGNSLSFTKNGKINARGRSFEEEMIMVNFNKNDEIPAKKISREEELFLALKLGIRDYFYKTGHKKCIVGLSGGIDSALTACLAVESLGKENVLCINMPSRFSSNHSKQDSKELGLNLGVPYKVLPIEDIFLMYEKIFNKEFLNFNRDVTEENIQARIRANFLMAYSNKLDYLLLATSNKTELALGYCTLYGDMSGSLSVISDLHKSDVYDVAKWYNQSIGKTIIPNSIFTKLPSAELNDNQTDPFDYSVVSPLVEEIVENQRTNEELITIGYETKLIKEIRNLIYRSEFKRKQSCPGLRVTKKAFGMGRRYPLINDFRNK